MISPGSASNQRVKTIWLQRYRAHRGKIQFKTTAKSHLCGNKNRTLSEETQGTPAANIVEPTRKRGSRSHAPLESNGARKREQDQTRKLTPGIEHAARKGLRLTRGHRGGGWREVKVK